MKVGWLEASPDYIGGAELTQAEFRAAAPEGVEIVDCPPGAVVAGLDRYVIQNCVPYCPEDLDVIGDTRTVKYVHDMWPQGDPVVRDRILKSATLIFCSPLHRERFPWSAYDDGEVSRSRSVLIPPPIDKTRFRPTRQAKRNGNRQGMCSIAGWRNPGKGALQVLEYAAEHGPVDVYGGGEFAPHGPNLNFIGELDPNVVPQTMWHYERLVFLPTDMEPFCRTIAEAHFAGLKVTTNGLVGATHWLEIDPGAIDTAAEDFWRVVLDG